MHVIVIDIWYSPWNTEIDDGKEIGKQNHVQHPPKLWKALQN